MKLKQVRRWLSYSLFEHKIYHGKNLLYRGTFPADVDGYWLPPAVEQLIEQHTGIVWPKLGKRPPKRVGRSTK